MNPMFVVYYHVLCLLTPEKKKIVYHRSSICQTNVESLGLMATIDFVNNDLGTCLDRETFVFSGNKSDMNFHTNVLVLVPINPTLDRRSYHSNERKTHLYRPDCL